MLCEIKVANGRPLTRSSFGGLSPGFRYGETLHLGEMDAALLPPLPASFALTLGRGLIQNACPLSRRQIWPAILILTSVFSNDLMD
jgi:hypothetical protein